MSNKKKPVHPSRQYKQPTTKVSPPEKSIKRIGQGQKWRTHMLVIVAFTIVAYLLSFGNDFIMNWDDAGYIINNDYIKSLSTDHIVSMFSDFYMSNYHPLTTLSYAIDYQISGENPVWYHVINLLVHLINALLVYRFIRKLLPSLSDWIPFASALLFAVHPMHVESVAWISERKDVLYTCFFLLGLIKYMDYSGKEKFHVSLWFLVTFMFLLSLLSKSAAVVFPVVLLAIDWYKRRKLTMIPILEKIPWFALSLWFGLMAIDSQDTAMQDLAPLLSLGERLLIVNYAFLTYLWKFILPVGLSAMYPYPLKVNDSLPLIYMIAPIITLGVAAIIIWFGRKNRELIFGLAFFIINIGLVLQLVPVGGVILSERYSYVPYIGLAIPAAIFFQRWADKQKAAKGLFVAVMIIFAALSFNRVTYWKNGDVLFTDVLDKYPKLPYAWNNRGFLYWDYYALKVYPDQPSKKQLYVNKAFADYTMALQLDPSYVQAWSNRAILLYNTGKINEALADFNQLLKLDPSYTDGLIGRANTLSTLKKYKESLPDYDAYLRIKGNDSRALIWRATALANLQEYSKAMVDLKKARSIDPADHEGWYWTGLCHYNTGETDSAIFYFKKTSELKPDFQEVYVWQGLALQKNQQFADAINSYNQALSYRPNDPVTLVNRAVAFYALQDYSHALSDLDAAGKQGYPLNKDFYEAVVRRDPSFKIK